MRGIILTLLLLCKAAAAENGLPDPTAPDLDFQQTFRALLRGQSHRNDNDLPSLPNVELIAKVLKPGQTPAALLKIDGRTFLVKAGSEITLIREGQTVHLHIQAITDDSTRILVLPYNEWLNLH